MLGKQGPKHLQERLRFRPTHVSITADHIGGGKDSLISQMFADPIEQAFQFQDVVQRLIGHDRVILAARTPAVEVRSGEYQVLRHALAKRILAPALQHRWT